MVNFLDRFLFNITRRKASPTEVVGATGTAVFGGFIEDKEKDPFLRGDRRYITYSNLLLNTSIVSASVRYFVNLVSKAAWKVVPAEEGGEEAERLAKLIDDMIRDMETPWHRVIRRAAMYRFYGFSVQEWTAKTRDDGVIGLLDISPRPQSTIERWDLDEDGRVRGIIQRNPQDQKEIYLPREKLMYLIDDTLNDSPEGLGLFRHLAKASKRLERYEELEGIGFENDLRGVPIGRGPFAELAKRVEQGKLSVKQKDALEKPLLDFLQQHIKNPKLSLLLDSATYTSQDERNVSSNIREWDFELMKGGNTSQEEIANTVERINRELARITGTEGLLLGEGSRGSFALSQDKTHNFALMVDSTLQELAEQIKNDIIKPIFMLNGWDMALLPSLKTEAVRYRDIEQITGALRNLALSGAPLLPDDPAIPEIRDLLGLSTPAETQSAEDAGLFTNPTDKPTDNPNDPEKDKLPERRAAEE